MYIDLIAVGMQKTLAKKFYEEIRCLSRSNIRPILSLNAWEVCFFYDFSEVVGKLLGKYVAEDESLLSTVRLPSTMSAKFLYGQTTPQGGSFLLNLFRDASHFRIYEPAEQKIQTSCCVSCIQDNYFLNIARDVCISDPFGKHCCHKACKSLGRLKIGASSSTNYCCEKITPMTCVR